MATWRTVPTSRRTSKTDRVDIVDEVGRFVAGYVANADALRMIHDPIQIAEDAINLYLEGLDRRDGDSEAARAYAMAEIIDAVNTDLDGEIRAFQADPSPAPENLDSLPF